ncbi:putative Dynein heavy chain 6; axonemal [Paratrimastix pyriformis]|uniref:Dynein heavy chain 6 n=1 Tax=Paratrimastix pyriformis TaxID=342808 RepID=A0ABQ8URB6_9EUKA|nr:putative Dynein heavy chain 6; axonemal [Paratrimastix pyriformis]
MLILIYCTVPTHFLRAIGGVQRHLIIPILIFCTGQMPTLEALVEGFSLPDAQLHPDFRLWLTSLPSRDFPVSVLQAGIKLTNEPPRGLRVNLMRSFNHITPSQFAECTKTFPWRRLLFGLCFFHGVIQERRKFGPLGWNIPYEWTSSDLEVSNTIPSSYVSAVVRRTGEYLDMSDEIPFDALLYIVGITSYGGRVTDPWDMRCLSSVLRRFFSPEFLQLDHLITPDGVYAPPPGDADLDEVRTLIHALPSNEPPAVFGLHNNANITFQQAEARALIGTIVNIQPRISGSVAGRTPDQVVLDMCADLAGRIPRKLDPSKAHPAVFAKGPDGVTVNSLGTVLSQECVRFNKLLRVIHKSLDDMQDAVKGLVVMSAALEAMHGAFLLGKVPLMWADAAYPSLKPLTSWVSDLIDRVADLRRWIEQGPPNCFWISGFFFPQGFLTGVLQLHARKTHLPIDMLRFDTRVADDQPWDRIRQPPPTGVYIRGLFVEGARWDMARHTLGESNPVPQAAGAAIEEPGSTPRYVCPVYKTGQRAGTLSTTGHSTNFILPLDVPIPRRHPPTTGSDAAWPCSAS